MEIIRCQKWEVIVKEGKLLNIIMSHLFLRASPYSLNK